MVQRKIRKKTKKIKKTIFRNSVKYIWMGPESCNIVFFWFFDFFSFFELFFFGCPGCEGVALCIQECGPCVIVYSGMGA